MIPITPGPPPTEALAWFRAKGFALGWDWRDVWREEHALAFTVAKIMELDLLADVRAAVESALADGQTFREFAQALTPVLQKAGWWGIQVQTDPLTGEQREVQLGSPRRLRVIYETNLRTARAAGQWERIQDTKDALPYLLYTLGPSREHRPEHVKWHGTLLPADDPWWSDHFPPNGWGCKCRVRPVSRREYARLQDTGVQAPPTAETQLPGGGRTSSKVPVQTTAPPSPTVPWENTRTGETVQVPVGIDPGWDYNPGARREHLDALLADKTRNAS